MFGNSGMSAADVAAVMRGNSGEGNNNGWGDGNGWWVLIILFALFGGWGRGYGNGGGDGASNGNGSVGADIQRGFDTQSIIQKLDGINQGLCSLGYDQLMQMNNINQNVTNTGYQIQNTLNQQTIAQMQSANALQAQLANCCCENRQGQADIKYTMASDTCQLSHAINQVGQNIINNDNANYRQIHDEITGLRIQDMRDQLMQKDAQLFQAQLAASQAAQTSQIVDMVMTQLRQCPIPSYNTPNPNCCYGPWGAMNWNGFLPQNGGNNCCGGC